MKHLKTKLVSAIAMLAVAAIMMTSATYAWFTISTNPEVKGASAYVTANGNLEIALDDGSNKAPGSSAVGDYGQNTTWGNMVDVSDFFTSAQVTLKPIQANLTQGSFPTFQYPEYGKDGRIVQLKDLSRISVTSSSNNYFNDLGGVKLLASSSGMVAQSSATAVANSGSIYGFEIDYWLRTNETDAHLLLKSSAIERDGITSSGMNGGGSYVSNSEVMVMIVCSSASEMKYYQAITSSAGRLELHEIKYDLTNSVWQAEDKASEGFAMPQNQAVAVRTYVFLDGTSMTNADAALSLESFRLNIQFMLDKDLTAMNVKTE